ncbi:DUF853 domain-containing protein, partial [Escherichia coli]|nr:DUF853 domain-containing protein [Escherichia coli]
IAAAEAEKQRIAEEKASRAAARNPDSFMETVGKSVARSASSAIGRQIGSQIVRGILGGIFGNTRRKSGWF